MSATDTAPSAELFATAPEAEAVEFEIVADIARRGIWFVPGILAVAALVAGWNGIASAAVAVALVGANFALAAASLAWAARINLGLLMGVALFGYLVRIGLLAGAVYLLQDLSWVHLATLGITLIVTHLGLLLWELRYVSASLARPGLKPSATSSSNPVIKERTP